MLKQINKKKSYGEYVEHQKSKINNFLASPKVSLSRVNFYFYDKMFYKALRNRLNRNPYLNSSYSSVLCLGARMGTEVKAFISLNYFAVGIDLEPASQNKYVVTGDFHKLQYADKSVDLIYTNSFDHSNNPNKLISEVKRVLKENGLFILEVSKGTKEGYKPQAYECIAWDTITDVYTYFEKNGFVIIDAYQDKIPFPLRSLTMRLKSQRYDEAF